MSQTQRVFFSHASEDKPMVLQVAERVKEAFPEIAPWIDKFEIAAGNDLIGKIGSGISGSERFLIFLSNRSIEKPWVRAELHDAITREINGHKPDFVVPVLLEEMPTMPVFLNAKRHIPLYSMIESEWLADIKGAIDGRVTSRPIERAQNLEVRIVPDPVKPHVGRVEFSPQMWAERASFSVFSRDEPIVADEKWIVGGFHAGHTRHRATYALEGGGWETCVARGMETITRGQTWAIRIRFDEGVSFANTIFGYKPWDGAGNSTTEVILATSFSNPDLPRLPTVYEEEED